MPVTDPALAPTLDEVYGSRTSTDASTSAPPASPQSFAEQVHGSQVTRNMFGPVGHWSSSLCSCWETFCSALFWMGVCCTPCLYGQLLQRLNMTCCAHTPSPDAPRVSIVCIRMLIWTTLIYTFFLVLGGYLFDALMFAFIVYCVVIGMILRSTVRRKFGIGPSCFGACDGALDDALIAWCCGCCSGIQMARHTHDETRYPYHGCGTNGLPSYAPNLWSDDLLLQATDGVNHNSVHCSNT